jgi:hypothetical protein
VHQKSSSPTSGLGCFDCGRALDSADGNVDVDSSGFVLCRECARAYLSYEDGRGDVALEILRAVVETVGRSVPHDRIHTEVARALSPHNGAAETIRGVLGLDRDDDEDEED